MAKFAKISKNVHVHGDTPTAGPVDNKTRVILGAAILPFVLLTVIGAALFWPKGHVALSKDNEASMNVDLVNGTVKKSAHLACEGGIGYCLDVRVLMTNGPDKGKTLPLPSYQVAPGTPVLKIGDKIVVGRAVDVRRVVSYYFSDYQRGVPLTVLALLFAVVVIAVGRWRGLSAILGLVIAYFVLVKFLLPAILAGRNPLFVCLIGGAAIMFPVMYLAHGPNARTTTALLGTLCSVALTGVLAVIFVGATHLSGASSEEVNYIQAIAGSINPRGLVLGGLIIGSLGVLNDVTVTQASAVWELHNTSPEMSTRLLYSSAMRIGRDHIASTVYTLVLAYAGAALPLLILFSLANRPSLDVITGDVVAEEIVRTLVGSIGLVASVPITTALATIVVPRRTDSLGAGAA